MQKKDILKKKLLNHLEKKEAIKKKSSIDTKACQKQEKEK